MVCNCCHSGMTTRECRAYRIEGTRQYRYRWYESKCQRCHIVLTIHATPTRAEKKAREPYFLARVRLRPAHLAWLRRQAKGSSPTRPDIPQRLFHQARRLLA